MEEKDSGLIKNEHDNENELNEFKKELKNMIKDVVVPDTSVIIQGVISKELERDSFKFKRIVIHEAVLAELESQANKGRETGVFGLEEIKRIREKSFEKGVVVDFLGNRPGDFEIKFAKSGEIDSLIRELARNQDATLLTADVVQAKVALAKGISVFLYDVSVQDFSSLLFEKFFIEDVSCVKLKEGYVPLIKKNGAWFNEGVLVSKDFLNDLIFELFEFIKSDPGSVVEQEKKFFSFLKIKDFNVLITKPPFSLFLEVSIIRSSCKKELVDFFDSKNVDSKNFLLDSLVKSSGLLVIGSVGEGKTCFVQSLMSKFIDLAIINSGNKNVSHDFLDFKNCSFFNIAQVNHSDLKDVLCFNNFKKVAFDEMRCFEDFRFLSELKLSGLSVVGVVSSSDFADAFLKVMSKVDFNVISRTFDKIVLINKGSVLNVFSVNLVRDLNQSELVISVLKKDAEDNKNKVLSIKRLGDEFFIEYF